MAAKGRTCPTDGTRDSSVGRAGDCSRLCLSVISRSAVRLRLAGGSVFCFPRVLRESKHFERDECATKPASLTFLGKLFALLICGWPAIRGSVGYRRPSVCSRHAVERALEQYIEQTDEKSEIRVYFVMGHAVRLSLVVLHYCQHFTYTVLELN